jgi:23S rRNA (cytosine1962-C5)-methyltransferase
VTPSAPPDLADRLLTASALRADLHADPKQTAYRLFHGYGEGCPGLCVDRLGDALIVTHTPDLEEAAQSALQPLISSLAPTLVVTKPRRGRGEPKALLGEPVDALEVLDNGLTFQIEPLAKRNEGLYLDARPARAWLLENSRERRVLNLFAYTGSLGLAAAAGGARWVTHVELQKRQLKRAKQNHLLNDLPVDDRNLVREDLYKHLRRAAKRELQVDGIILDPPPMVPARGSHRPPGQDYTTLIPLTAPRLTPGGWLLCFFHRKERTLADYEAEIQSASPVPLEVLARGASGTDYPEDDPQAKLRFTAFVRPV